MLGCRENRAVLAAMAPAAGISFFSGQTTVLFFSQMGKASWAGVFLSAALYGMLCAMACRLFAVAGEKTFSGMHMRLAGTVVNALYGLFAIAAACVLLLTAGKLALLSLPSRNAFPMGVLAALVVALLLNMGGRRALPVMGALITVICLGFHIFLALDPRPAPIVQCYETRAHLSGSVVAALMLATLHAALCASASIGTLMFFLEGEFSALRIGLKCGAIMLVLLLTSNAAVLRGGVKLLSRQMPTVVLAARWGKAGYGLSIGIMGLCTVCALASVVRASADGISGALRDGKVHFQIREKVANDDKLLVKL